MVTMLKQGKAWQSMVTMLNQGKRGTGTWQGQSTRKKRI